MLYQVVVIIIVLSLIILPFVLFLFGFVFLHVTGDLHVLRHDKSVLHPLRKQEHLKHIPDYLMPRGLQTGEDPTQVGPHAGLLLPARWWW